VIKIQVVVFSILKMEAARSSKTFVTCHITTWCLNPEVSNLNKLQMFDIVLKETFGPKRGDIWGKEDIV
jgi:hypothetical protein